MSVRRCVCKNEIPDGGRSVAIPELHVAWGADDLRDDWTGGPYVFCSFGCLSDWAEERAADHDGRVLVEGGSP